MSGSRSRWSAATGRTARSLPLPSADVPSTPSQRTDRRASMPHRTGRHPTVHACGASAKLRLLQDLHRVRSHRREKIIDRSLANCASQHFLSQSNDRDHASVTRNEAFTPRLSGRKSELTALKNLLEFVQASVSREPPQGWRFLARGSVDLLEVHYARYRGVHPCRKQSGRSPSDARALRAPQRPLKTCRRNP
jgi:hypothetical protein